MPHKMHALQQHNATSRDDKKHSRKTKPRTGIGSTATRQTSHLGARSNLPSTVTTTEMMTSRMVTSCLEKVMTTWTWTANPMSKQNMCQSTIQRKSRNVSDASCKVQAIATLVMMRLIKCESYDKPFIGGECRCFHYSNMQQSRRLLPRI